MLRSQLIIDRTEHMTVKVDLSELASLAKDANCARDFNLCTERLVVVSKGNEMQVQVAHSQQSAEVEKMDHMVHLLRRISRCFQGIDAGPRAWEKFSSLLDANRNGTGNGHE